MWQSSASGHGLCTVHIVNGLEIIQRKSYFENLPFESTEYERAFEGRNLIQVLLLLSSGPQIQFHSVACVSESPSDAL